MSSADQFLGSPAQAVVLASESVARRMMLEQAGFSVTVIPSGAPEDESRSTPGDTVEHLSRIKMEAVLHGGTIPRDLLCSPVITADTIVTSGERIFGKPGSREDAREMLRELSGMTHSVFSGFCLYFPEDNELFSGYDEAQITFFALGELEIETYLQTEEWRSAAGAYRIQQKGISLISSIEGSYFTVAGLPIHEIFGIVRKRMFR